MFNTDSTEQIDVTPYMECLKTAGHRVKLDFAICNCKVTSEELVSLIVAARDSRIISFYSCLLITDNPISFGNQLDDATFKTLDLNNTGENSDWANNPQRLRNILKALGEVAKVRKRLREIYLDNSGLSIEEIEQMLKECNLENVEVYDMD